MLKWYEKTGKNTDVVLSSRIRLARNTTEYPFSTKITADEGKNLVDRVFECIGDSEYADGFELKRMNGVGDNQRQCLYEQQEINRYMAGRKDGAAAFSHDGGLSIMVNSEDHIRIQAMIAGMDMEACLKSANMYDDLLEEHFNYAFSEKYGYHTTYPTNVGTGMRAAYRLHLPVLANTKKLQLLANELGRFGVRMSACFGEGLNGMGDIYQFSNQRTLGQSEEDIIHNLDSVVQQIVRQERTLRKDYLDSGRIRAEDEAYKSYGVLKYSRCLNLKNAMVLLSEIRLGLCLGTIRFKDAEDFSTYSMMLAVQPRTLQFNNCKEKAMSVEEVVENVGVSKTTGRRYLEYCVESGLIIVEMLYGNIGHPRRLYRKADDKP